MTDVAAGAPSAEVLAVTALADARLKPDLADTRSERALSEVQHVSPCTGGSRAGAHAAPALAEVHHTSAGAHAAPALAEVHHPSAEAHATPVLAEVHHASAEAHATPVLMHAEFRAEAQVLALGTDASPQALLATHVRTAFARAGRDLEGQEDGEEPTGGRGRGYRAAVLALMDCLRPRAGETKETQH